MDAQADLEKTWLEAWYTQQYWVEIDKWLNKAESGSSTEAFETKRAAIAVSDDTDPETLEGATALSSSTDGDLLSAEKDLLELEATTALAAAAVAELGKRILRADLELAELEKLVSVNGGDAGTLDLALTKRKSEFEDYDNGEFKSATDDKAAAEAAIKARSGDKETVDDVEQDKADGGALKEAVFSTEALWTKAKETTVGAESELTDALGGSVLAELRKAVEDAQVAWKKEQDKIDAA